MDKDVNFRRNVFVALILLSQLIAFAIIVAFFKNPALHFPFLLLFVFSGSLFISLYFEIGVIIYICEIILLTLFFLITKYPVPFRIDYFLIAIFLGVKFFLEKKREQHQAENAKVELESLKERGNLNNTQYLELAAINEALEKKICRFTDLRKYSEDIIASLNLEELLQITAQKIVEIIAKGEVSLAYLFESKQETFKLSASYSISQKLKIKAKTGDACDYWVFRQRTPLLIADILRDFRFDSDEILSQGREFRSLISAPIISRNRLLGLLRIDSNYPGEFTADDLRLLDIVADLSAIAIDNAFLFQKMEELAMHDGLTEFYLRREFLSLLDKELKIAKRKGILALFMIDIDDFKERNDTYGHIAGDLIIRNIAAVIKSHLGEDEYACRYGGEEFLLLINAEDKKKIVQRARMIQEAVADSKVRIRRNDVCVTITVGIAFYPSDGKRDVELIEISDNRLYEGKRSGKNRVVYE